MSETLQNDDDPDGQLFVENLNFSGDESIAAMTIWKDELVTVGRNIRIWNEQGLVQTFERVHIGAITCCEVMNNFLVTTSFDRTIIVWNREGKCVRVLRGHIGWVISLCKWESQG